MLANQCKHNNRMLAAQPQAFYEGPIRSARQAYNSRPGLDRPCRREAERIKKEPPLPGCSSWLRATRLRPFRRLRSPSTPRILPGSHDPPNLDIADLAAWAEGEVVII